MGDEGRVRIRMNWDLWQGIEGSPDPVVSLDRRAQEQLAMEGYDGTEIAYVSRDPVYQQSVREEYQSVRYDVRERNRFPKQITIRFTRPGTRDAKGRKEPVPDSAE